MRKLWCLLLGLLCTGATLAQPPLKTPYYPLEIGQRWTYRLRDASAPQPKGGQVREVVVEVEREEPFTRKETKGDKELEVKHTGFLLKMSSGDKVTRDHVIVLEQGVHRIHSSGMALNPPVLFFKLGVKPGETWTAETVSRDMTIKATFSWKNDIVEVPYGEKKYAAILVSSVLRRGEERDEVDCWFVNGIGMAKQRIKSKNHDLVMELVSMAK